MVDFDSLKDKISDAVEDVKDKVTDVVEDVKDKVSGREEEAPGGAPETPGTDTV